MNTSAKTFRVSALAAAASLLVASATLSAPALAASDYLLEIDGVKGESFDGPKSKSVIVLERSVIVDVGLGGTTPASLNKTGNGELQLAGPGHYSTMTSDTLVLDGDLKISTYYGFEPQPGDSFQIMTANRHISGEFIGLPEGGYVACTDSNVCLRISYQGGDGNDVVLTAEQNDTAILIGILLPAVQVIRDAANTTTAQTREHVLLSRQVGVPSLQTGIKLPPPTPPIITPPPPRK